MDLLLGRVTQQAVNYAIRSGITITSTYAIRQCSRLLQSVEGDEHDELAGLQGRLEGKIRIISPAIDLIELIAARGNSSLESAVSLTKSLRWDIQALGLRLAKAANREETSGRTSGKKRIKTRAQRELEFKSIIRDVRTLLDRIEDAVPLINLAITTSGARLSSNLPSTISPSRLLQASTFLTAGDTQYVSQPTRSQQIGPTFTLSLYMLFQGHANRPREDDGGVKETTWQEVMHKARVKLYRVSIEQAYDLPSARPLSDEREPHDRRPGQHESPTSPLETDDSARTFIGGEGRADEFAYQLLLVEDLEDGRVHSYEDGEPQPESFDGVAQAGLREVIPIHQISKIFYADTGKILNIGTDAEANNPVLLLKRDVNAFPPRRMMERTGQDHGWFEENSFDDHDLDTDASGDQSELNAQIDREQRDSSIPAGEDGHDANARQWRLKANLDPEWMAFEVYVEDPDSDSEDDTLPEEESKSASKSPRSPQEEPRAPELSSIFSSLSIRESTPSPGNQTSDDVSGSPRLQLIETPAKSLYDGTPSSFVTTAGPVRTSLSLLETLIRLTALQQFQQTSHLSITDELLNFFLSESSTTGAGNDGDERRRKRWEARQRLGFDPYDDSPVRRREQGLEENDGNEHRQMLSPDALYDEEYHFGGLNEDVPFTPSPLLLRQGYGRRGVASHTASPSPSLPQSNASDRSSRQVRHSGDRTRRATQRASSTRSSPCDGPSSPPSLGDEKRSGTGHAQSRTQQGLLRYAARASSTTNSNSSNTRNKTNPRSPLGRGRGASVETDSTLGTSPGYRLEEEAGGVEAEGKAEG